MNGAAGSSHYPGLSKLVRAIGRGLSHWDSAPGCSASFPFLSLGVATPAIVLPSVDRRSMPKLTDCRPHRQGSMRALLRKHR